jgi:hypothetical protein
VADRAGSDATRLMRRVVDFCKDRARTDGVRAPRAGQLNAAGAAELRLDAEVVHEAVMVQPA